MALRYLLWVSVFLGACRPAEESSLDAVSDEPIADTSPAPGARAEVNGTTLYYEIRGEGEPLVLVNGAHLDSRMWDEPFDALAEHYRVIRYDLRGTGRSALPDESFAHHEDLRALLEFLEIERGHLLGFSIGGGVAIDFTLANPDAVEALILVAPRLSSAKKDVVPELDALMAAAREEGEPKPIETMLEAPSLLGPEHEEVRSRVREIWSSNPGLFDAGFAYLRLMKPLEPPADGRLGGIAAPTLLVVGELDEDHVQENVDGLQAAIGGAKKVMVMGAGHMLVLEEPEEIVRVMIDFLGQYSERRDSSATADDSDSVVE